MEVLQVHLTPTSSSGRMQLTQAQRASLARPSAATIVRQWGTEFDGSVAVLPTPPVLPTHCFAGAPTCKRKKDHDAHRRSRRQDASDSGGEDGRNRCEECPKEDHGGAARRYSAEAYAHPKRRRRSNTLASITKRLFKSRRTDAGFFSGFAQMRDTIR